MTYFRLTKGKGDGDYSGLDTVSSLLFDYNIYFENAHVENIFKIINIFLEVDLPLACMTYFRWKRGKKKGTTVVWMPSQAYYSTITFILKMQIWKIFKESSIYS